MSFHIRHPCIALVTPLGLTLLLTLFDSKPSGGSFSSLSGTADGSALVCLVTRETDSFAELPADSQSFEI